MASTTSPTPDERRRRIRYRAWHRGMREVDLLLGPFADSMVAAMSGQELAAFEALLDWPDQTIYAAVVSGDGAVDDGPGAVVSRVRRFHEARVAHARG